MRLKVKVGDTFEMKGRTITVTELQVEVLPRVIEVLSDVARERTTISYGALKAMADLPHPPNGLGRLLDVLSYECEVQNIPSLAALVVNATTGEVGADYEGSPDVDRAKVYASLEDR